MNSGAFNPKMQAHISQAQRNRGFLPALAGTASEPRILPPTPSPKHRSFAWQGAEDDADHRRVWFTHSLLLQPDTWQTTEHGSTVVRLQGRPYIAAHQQGVSIDRQFSRIFPAHLRSLARCFSRARRELRGSASLWRAPCGFRFPENLLCKERAKHFPDPPEKHRLPLGAGHTRVASRRSVPEAIRANTKQEK